MASEDFTHHIAIKLSRALNLINPNDTLAKRVVDIASTSTPDAFLTGSIFPSFASRSLF
jgi:pre-mRNA-splicing factor ATP-dependent RNA helicase DHX38/PRP16